MIRDKLNLQGNTLERLEKGCTLYLETEKHRRLEVKLVDEGEKKNE